MMGHELTSTYPGNGDYTTPRSALDRARTRQADANLALEIVESQAVAALLREGRTVREISTDLGLSKSKVGRIAAPMKPASFAATGFRSPIPLAWAVREDQKDSLAAQIQALWA